MHQLSTPLLSFCTTTGLRFGFMYPDDQHNPHITIITGCTRFCMHHTSSYSTFDFIEKKKSGKEIKENKK
jgi:hypothetical protein